MWTMPLVKSFEAAVWLVRASSWASSRANFDSMADLTSEGSRPLRTHEVMVVDEVEVFFFRGVFSFLVFSEMNSVDSQAGCSFSGLAGLAAADEF